MAVVHQSTVDLAHAALEILQIHAHDRIGDHLEHGALNIVSPTDREHEAVTVDSRVRSECEVGGRIVGVEVHGIGAMATVGGREADVEGARTGNHCHGFSSSRSAEGAYNNL